MASKKPAYQWYPGDWRKDPGVRALSSEAKAFWREALDVLFESPTRGRFTATKEGWAAATGFPVSWVEKFIVDNLCLKVADVTDCDGSVTLCNRRMFREEQEAEAERERVRIAMAEKRKREKTLQDSDGDVTECYSPSSSSSSSSTSKQEPPKPPKGGAAVDYFVPDFDEWWQGYPNKQGRPKAHLHYVHWRNVGRSREELIRARDRYKAAKAKAGSETFANGSTFLNPKPKGDSANIADYFDENFQPSAGRRRQEKAQRELEQREQKRKYQESLTPEGLQRQAQLVVRLERNGNGASRLARSVLAASCDEAGVDLEQLLKSAGAQ